MDAKWTSGLIRDRWLCQTPLGCCYLTWSGEYANNDVIMMTSSNGNIFRLTGHLWGNSPVAGEFPAQRPVTRSFDVFFDLRLNKRLGKQSWGWWFETPSPHYDAIVMMAWNNLSYFWTFVRGIHWTLVVLHNKWLFDVLLLFTWPNCWITSRWVPITKGQ